MTQPESMGETIPRRPEMMKVWLPGERPWAEVLSHNADGTRTVRLDNILAGDYTAEEFGRVLAKVMHVDQTPRGDMRKHAYRYNDVVNVKLNPEYGLWEVIGYASTN